MRDKELYKEVRTTIECLIDEAPDFKETDFMTKMSKCKPLDKIAYRNAVRCLAKVMTEILSKEI